MGNHSLSGQVHGTGKSVLLFAGLDLIGQVIVTDLCRKLLAADFGVFVVYPERYKMGNHGLWEIKEKDFLQGGILQNYIYPFLDALPHPQDTPCLSPAQLQSCLGVRVFRLSPKGLSQPDSSIAHLVRKGGVVGAVAIRYPFIFKKETITLLKKETGFFWNLHSAELPRYQGLSPLKWMLYHGERQGGFTLHQIDAGIDTGNIVAYAPQPLNLKRSVFQNLLQLCGGAAKLTFENIENHHFSLKNVLPLPPKGEANYYAALDAEGLRKLKDKGVVLVDKKEMVDDYCHLFSLEEGGQRRDLWKVLTRAYKDFFNSGI